MQSILQIFKVNEKRSGEKDGRKWEMQDAECGLMDADGVIQAVGVLPIPRDLLEKVTPGVYMGSFALRPEMRTRRIMPVLVGLQPYAVAPVKAPPASPLKG